MDHVPPEEAKAQAERCLERFGLNGLEARHPYQLSTGQKRRLSVATAMARQPSVLLLDEPTFGQDARNTFAILEMCEKSRRAGTAILMVTHEMEVAQRVATHIWEIREGQLTSSMPSPRWCTGTESGREAGGVNGTDETRENLTTADHRLTGVNA